MPAKKYLVYVKAVYVVEVEDQEEIFGLAFAAVGACGEPNEELHQRVKLQSCTVGGNYALLDL